MMPRRLAALAIAAAVTAAVPAQSQQGGGRPTPPSGEAVIPKAQKIFPTDVQWTLALFNGKPPGPDRPTILVDGQFRARGFGGCNTFSAAAYPMAGQRFAVGPIAATRKACPKEVMDAEKAFLVAFRTAQAWDTKDGYLIIADQGGEMRFVRAL